MSAAGEIQGFGYDVVREAQVAALSAKYDFFTAFLRLLYMSPV
jgi:hypothetical protein